MFNAIIEFFEAIGKARAAATLARMGHYELAKKVMSSDTPAFNDHPFEVHP
jgi:hypothetical protein|tara:strand:+ start:412 stop:564 length:153 start_codon:yes stop_codon:yes gene_type:complete